MPQHEGVWVPDRWYWFWKGSGRCIDCNQDLRHYRHLQNHWVKWHAPAQYSLFPTYAEREKIWDTYKKIHQQQRFFVWNPYRRKWLEISRNRFIWLQTERSNRCFAYTKEQR